MGIDLKKLSIGSIAVVSKIAGVALPGYVVYCSTKAIPLTIVATFAAFFFVYALEYRWRSRFYRRLNETDLPIKILSDTPSHFNGKTINEAAQGQFVFASNHEVLATSHVHQCNLLIGWCEELGLAFLCHTDLQLFIGNMSKFFESLDAHIKSLTPDATKNRSTKYSFTTTLVGGQTWWIYP